MNSPAPSTSSRYSTAGIISHDDESASAIAVQRASGGSCSSRIQRFTSQNTPIHSGTCNQRMKITGATPSPVANALNGANTYHCSGVWFCQKSRYGTRPRRIQSVARKNSTSS